MIVVLILLVWKYFFFAKNVVLDFVEIKQSDLHHFYTLTFPSEHTVSHAHTHTHTHTHTPLVTHSTWTSKRFCTILPSPTLVAVDVLVVIVVVSFIATASVDCID